METRPTLLGWAYSPALSSFAVRCPPVWFHHDDQVSLVFEVQCYPCSGELGGLFPSRTMCFPSPMAIPSGFRQCIPTIGPMANNRRQRDPGRVDISWPRITPAKRATNTQSWIDLSFTAQLQFLQCPVHSDQFQKCHWLAMGEQNEGTSFVRSVPGNGFTASVEFFGGEGWRHVHLRQACSCSDLWTLINHVSPSFRCGLMTYFIPFPLSFIHTQQPILQAALLATYFDSPCKAACANTSYLDHYSSANVTMLQQDAPTLLTGSAVQDHGVKAVNVTLDNNVSHKGPILHCDGVFYFCFRAHSVYPISTWEEFWWSFLKYSAERMKMLATLPIPMWPKGMEPTWSKFPRQLLWSTTKHHRPTWNWPQLNPTCPPAVQCWPSCATWPPCHTFAIKRRAWNGVQRSCWKHDFVVWTFWMQTRRHRRATLGPILPIPRAWSIQSTVLVASAVSCMLDGGALRYCPSSSAAFARCSTSILTTPSRSANNSNASSLGPCRQGRRHHWFDSPIDAHSRWSWLDWTHSLSTIIIYWNQSCWMDKHITFNGLSRSKRTFLCKRKWIHLCLTFSLTTYIVAMIKNNCELPLSRLYYRGKTSKSFQSFEFAWHG